MAEFDAVLQQLIDEVKQGLHGRLIGLKLSDLRANVTIDTLDVNPGECLGFLIEAECLLDRDSKFRFF